ncbi:MAG: single-stranded DNA-binding protein [Polyangiales bacterium]
MSNSLNKVMIIGNIGADPEFRSTPSGQSVLKFRVATNESWKDKNGQLQEHAEWHTVNIWGPRAEALQRFLAKGTRVYVEGKLRTDSYEKDGVTRYNTTIRADELIFLDSRGGGGGGGGGGAPRGGGGGGMGGGPRGGGGGGGGMGGGPRGGGGGGGGGRAPADDYPPDDFGGGGDSDDIPF